MRFNPGRPSTMKQCGLIPTGGCPRVDRSKACLLARQGKMANKIMILSIRYVAGKIVKCGSGSIHFKCVRQHVLADVPEPHAEYVQWAGRTVHTNSHVDVPEDERLRPQTPCPKDRDKPSDDWVYCSDCDRTHRPETSQYVLRTRGAIQITKLPEFCCNKVGVGWSLRSVVALWLLQRS